MNNDFVMKVKGICWKGALFVLTVMVFGYGIQSVAYARPSFTQHSVTFSVNENEPKGTVVGNLNDYVQADDDDDDYTIYYNIVSSGYRSFTKAFINTWGEISTREVLDFETKSSYTVGFYIMIGQHPIDWITVTVNVTDVEENSVPVFTEGSRTRRWVDENEPIGTNVGAPLSVNSVEGVHHYFVYATSNDPDRSWFSVGVNSGQLKTKQVFDYETKNSYAIAVDLYSLVDGAVFLVDSIIVTINVKDVEETPTNTAPSFTGTRTTRSITERIPSNQNIGHPVSATDADNDTLTYTLGGTNALAFSIDSSTGQLQTKIPLDYETKNQYTVTVTVSDGSLSDTITVTINVTERDRDIKRGPAFTEGKNTTRSVAENTPSGVNLGVPLLATDPDGDTLTYSLGGTDKASFSFESSTSQLKTKAPLDYETKNRYTVTISAFDGYLHGVITVTITVTDVFEPTTNSPPAFTEGDSAARAIAENSSTGLGFGAPVSATDADGDTLTYSLGGTDAASFSIYSITGYLRTKAQLDYETKNQYTVTVFVSDGNGGSDSITVTINVTDIYEPWTNDSPVFTEGSRTSRAIAEDTPPNSNIGDPVSATDADNDTLIYTLGGTDQASFSIDSDTGQLKTKAPLDYETKNRYTVRVFVSDGNGGSDNITVTITLRPDWVTNSYPSFTEGDRTTRAIAENTPPGVNIGDPVSATDPDGDTLTYIWASTNASTFFSIDSSTGQLRTKIPLDYKRKKRYSVAVAVIDGKFGSDTIRVIVNVTEVNPPSFHLNMDAGVSLIHIPLKVSKVNGVPRSLERISDLYDALGGAATVSTFITFDTTSDRWELFAGDVSKGGPGDRILSDDLGILIVLLSPVSVQLEGDALGTDGSSVIRLEAGVNFVGIPLNNEGITHVSDLFTVDGIRDNVSVIISHNRMEFGLVTPTGGPGDIPITGGQSFIMTALNRAEVSLTGAGWYSNGITAAPLMAGDAVQARGVTPVLGVTGSIQSSVGGASLPRPFHVTVKNCSTGKMDTVPVSGEGFYQLTFVDIAGGPVAQVGDILELTGQSSNPSIGVQPVRHVVTAEDVRRAHIQLAALVTYEIPAKTKLLTNYPNPFNPETWIPYRLAKDAFVRLEIYDQRGHKVRQLEVGHRIAAVYERRDKAIYWDGRNAVGERVASGIYFYHLSAGDYSAMRKMVVVK